MEEEFYHQNIFGEVVDVNLIVHDKDEELPIDKKGAVFNIFRFTDAIGARNKRQAWILYEEALAAGISPEEIFWKVVWQVKTMLLVLRTSSAEEAGMKTFPYNKAKNFIKNFQVSELKDLSTFLVVGYHETRRGRGEMETLIEKFILGL
jgi:DNA polymerase III delta subunit